MSFFVSLAKANAEVARLNTDLTTLTAERETLKAAIVERDSAAESVRAQFDATLADLTEKLSLANASVAKLTEDAKTAATQAAELVAAQGVPADKLPPSDGKTKANAAELATQIRAESDPAKRAALFAQLQTVWNSKN